MMVKKMGAITAPGLQKILNLLKNLSDLPQMSQHLEILHNFIDRNS